MGIIPFIAPENLAYRSAEFGGIGNHLVDQLHLHLVEAGVIPIVEVFGRQSWPRKREDFGTGNHQAIAFARDAGFDLVVVGQVETDFNLKALTALVRVIDVESGTTIYLGRSVVERKVPIDPLWELNLNLHPGSKEPGKLHLNRLVEDLANCIAAGMLSTEAVP